MQPPGRGLAGGIVALALLSPVTAAAPAPPAEPEDFVRLYVRTLLGGDRAALAALMHDDALAELKDGFARILHADAAGDLAQSIFRVTGPSEFLELPAAEVHACYMRFHLPDDAEAAELLRGVDVAVRHVEPTDRPGTVAARYRMSFPAAYDVASLEETLHLRRQRGEWRALLKPGTLQMLESLFLSG